MREVGWPKHKDRGGVTYITVKDVRYKVTGTGHKYTALLRMIKANKAEAVTEGDDT